jgi:hypothetical protein
LYYGINDISCPNGGNPVATTGTLAATLNNQPLNTVIYVKLTDSSGTPIAQCGQEATNTYCASYSCGNNPYGTSNGTGNLDISVKGDPIQTC